MTPGTLIRLCLPDNPRLDGALATVLEPTDWGAHVCCQRAATGRFRASHEEMVPYAQVNGVRRVEVMARDQGYSGEACADCGSFRMRRTGSCTTCEDCGRSGGCV